jgi:hypothetical protein
MPRWRFFIASMHHVAAQRQSIYLAPKRSGHFQTATFQSNFLLELLSTTRQCIPVTATCKPARKGDLRHCHTFQSCQGVHGPIWSRNTRGAKISQGTFRLDTVGVTGSNPVSRTIGNPFENLTSPRRALSSSSDLPTLRFPASSGEHLEYLPSRGAPKTDGPADYQPRQA